MTDEMLDVSDQFPFKTHGGHATMFECLKGGFTASRIAGVSDDEFILLMAFTIGGQIATSKDPELMTKITETIKKGVEQRRQFDLLTEHEVAGSA